MSKTVTNKQLLCSPKCRASVTCITQLKLTSYWQTLCGGSGSGTASGSGTGGRNLLAASATGAHPTCADANLKPYANTPTGSGLCSCGKDWASANTGGIRCIPPSGKSSTCSCTDKPCGTTGDECCPYKDTPSTGVCSCGK